jgi:hypothetical protein
MVEELVRGGYLYLNTGFDNGIIDCWADITSNPHSKDLGP